MSDTKDLVPISGAKGGGGGHTPVEYKDTLKTKQTVKLLFAVSEGEIESIDDIYLNGASINEYAGKVSYDVRYGTADQTVIPGFVETESPLTGAGSFPVELFKDEANIYQLLGDVSAARITLNVPRLMAITAQGDRVGTKVIHEIYSRYTPDGGSPTTWSLVAEILKKGKTTKPYSWDIRVDRPTGCTADDTWEIKIVRTSENDPNDRRYSQSYLQQITKVYDLALTYPGTALVAITISSTQVFGGNIPDVKFIGKGIKIPLPTNYNPVTRTYNEITPWDGSFKTVNEYTNNLAWILYFVLTNSEKGLGISPSEIDLGSVYNFAKYCDEMVSDGRGGTEPRYTVDQQFIERQPTPEFLTYLLSLGNANFSSNAFGQLSIIFDAPGQVISFQVSNANVIDGMFNYSSNDLETRVSHANATYSDKRLKGETNTAFESDPDLEARYGYQVTDIALPGCTSEARAKRKCRWALWTNSVDTDLITFKLGLYGASLHVGMLGNIMDSENASASSYHAVIKNFSVDAGVTTIELDREMQLLNEDYTVSLILQDGTTIENKPIPQKNGNFSSISVAASISPFIGTTILFASASLIPRVGKIIRIEKEENEYTITCVQHSEEKYAYIDGIGDIQDYDPSGHFVNFDSFSVEPVVNLSVEEIFYGDSQKQFAKLTVDWDWDLDGNQKIKPEYRLSYSYNDDNPILIEGLEISSYDILDPNPGIYEISVWVVNPFSGLESAALTLTYNYRTEEGVSTLQPPVNARVVGTSGTIFNTIDLSITWDFNPLNDAVAIVDVLSDYIVELWDASGTALQRVYTVPLNPDKGGNFTLSYSENISIFGDPARTVLIKIYSRDTIGDKSTALTVSFSNPHPVIPSWNIVPLIDSVKIDIQRSEEVDVVEYRVYASDTADFVKDITTLAYSGADNQIILEAEGGITRYYAISVIDSFGDSGAPISGEMAATSYTAEPDRFVYTGLIFKPNDPSTNKLSWTAGEATKNGTTTWSISANPAGALWTSGTMYVYYVPGNTFLSTTTSMIEALADGGRILASYRGGTDLANDAGRAYIDGDTIIAGSIGASQLATNTAVITGAAQIANAVITNSHIANATIDYGKISDSLQSTNWNLAAHTGWKISKTGGIQTHDLTVYDSSGNIVLQSGSRIDFANLIGSTKPADNATVGAPAGTLVAGVSATTVATAATNFNASNDRNPAAIVAPVVPLDGTAIDHTIQSNGSADISFEWFWSGTEGDIDGFQVFVYQAASAAAYTFGTTPAAENVFVVPANKRAFILYGVIPDRYYTFGVRAYRSVDKDINATGVIVSTLVKSTASGENPYRPSSTVAFAGNITGTIATSGGNIAAANVNNWDYVFGVNKPASGATANPITVSFANPAPAGGTDGSFHVNLSTGALWSKANGTWRIAIPKFTSANISTFIDNLAISSALIADAAIVTAKIGTAQVDTLQVKGGAITAPESAYLSSYTPAGINEANNQTSVYLGLLYLALAPVDINTKRIIMLSFNFRNNDSTPGALRVGVSYSLNGGADNFPAQLARGVTPGFDLINGMNNMPVVIVGYLDTVAGGNYTLRVDIALDNIGSTYKWNNTNPPNFYDVTLVAFTGKR